MSEQSPDPEVGARNRHRGPFTPMTKGAARAFVTLSAITMIIALAGFLWTASAVRAANGRARAQCRFDAHLGAASAAPLMPSPAMAQPSLLAMQIVSDARVAWRQAGCTGKLPPPDPSFKRWAAYYHLPAG